MLPGFGQKCLRPETIRATITSGMRPGKEACVVLCMQTSIFRGSFYKDKVGGGVGEEGGREGLRRRAGGGMQADRLHRGPHLLGGLIRGPASSLNFSHHSITLVSAVIFLLLVLVSLAADHTHSKLENPTYKQTK